MHEVASSNSDYCISALAEDGRPAGHFQFCAPQSNRFYPSPTTPGLQLSLAGLPPLPQGMLKAMTRQMQGAQSDFQPHTVRIGRSEAAGPEGPEKKRGAAKAGRRGRPSGTTKSAGYRTSTGRPLGTTRAAGFKTSPGRPLGTTKAAGYKVSPGRPPGSIKSRSRSKKPDFNNCSIPKKLYFASCGGPPFPYTMSEKRPFGGPSSKVDETS